MKPFIRFLARVLVAALAASEAHAANFYVDTAAQFNSAVDKNGASFATLSAGDRVYLKGGNWDGLRRLLTGSMTDAAARANPAVIYACDANYVPTIGGVTVDGLSQIQLAGTGITFTGVTFSPKSGMYKAGNYTDYSGNESMAYIFNLPALSRYMTSHTSSSTTAATTTPTTPTTITTARGRWLMVTATPSNTARLRAGILIPPTTSSPTLR